MKRLITEVSPEAHAFVARKMVKHRDDNPAKNGEALHLVVKDLGRQPYLPVLHEQERLVDQRKADAINDVLVLVEHEHVYTLGRNARADNILVSRAELEKRGIPVVETGRGGDVTYHGPGQLVGYPILDLNSRGQGVLWYVSALEQVLIRTALDFGVRATTLPPHRGVWVGDNKLAAIGVRVTGGVTMHGFALNVCTDLSYFNAIIPCGIRDKGVTSLQQLGVTTTLEAVKERIIERFCEFFGYCGWAKYDNAPTECCAGRVIGGLRCAPPTR
ncbi:MAG: lipoyl(octanoyl) transferase LipB [Kiritimatiellae bacterium]|nr:lipoyl(octanoyl) transferase LipB [Kiritimatiellia bacterium]